MTAPALGHSLAIGVFDSGVGGLSVLRELRALLPEAATLYVADSKYVPYGEKTPDFIRERSAAIMHFLAERRPAAVVVACNTATTYAIDRLRHDYPAIPIVGMEPAIKPAARATRTGVVGILATEATLAGERVTKLIERNADGIHVLTQPCPGLVERVEAGDLSGPETVALITRYTAPLVSRGADTLVLGCTHYTFLRHAIEGVVGPAVTLFDSAAAVARQTARVLRERGTAAGAEGQTASTAEPVGLAGSTTFFTSGEVAAVRRVFEALWPGPPPDLRPLGL
jgi:glutamate racemase